MARKPLKKRRSHEQTEAMILRAAEEVFIEKDYLAATVADIVKRAGISHGAFYLYFANKDDVFAKVVSRVVDDLFALSGATRTGTFRDRVEDANRGYLEAFNRHRHVMRSLVQVATFKPEMARLHHQLRMNFIRRIRRHLEKNVARGVCYSMDTEVTSYALGFMIDWFAYLWLAAGALSESPSLNMERIVTALTDLWCRAIYKDSTGLSRPPESRFPDGARDSVPEPEPRAREAGTPAGETPAE